MYWMISSTIPIITPLALKLGTAATGWGTQKSSSAVREIRFSGIKASLATTRSPPERKTCPEAIATWYMSGIMRISEHTSLSAVSCGGITSIWEVNGWMILEETDVCPHLFISKQLDRCCYLSTRSSVLVDGKGSVGGRLETTGSTGFRLLVSRINISIISSFNWT